MAGNRKGKPKELSPKEIENRYRWIWAYWQRNKRSPTFREIAESWNISPSAVRHSLGKFVKLGWMAKHAGRNGIKPIVAFDE